MLYFLLAGFVLSQAYRTVGGILSVPLKAEFMLDSDRLASVIGSFHIAFGCLQVVIGILIDNFGIRKTILAVSPFSVLGALLSAVAVSPTMLQWGQILLGFGCAPAFLACIVLMARHFSGKQFSIMYAFALGSGSLGLIFTSTPTAWLVGQFGWRSCFYLLAFLSFLTWLLIYFGVRGVDSALAASSLSVKQKIVVALRSISGYKALLKIRETPGILSLVFVIYAAFLTLRGLWLGPLLVERHHASLVFAGNLALLLSIISVFSPMLFGRLDPGPGKRYVYLCIQPWVLVIAFIVLAFSQQLWLSIVAIMVIAVAAANTVWQLADAKEVYPQDMQGRAIALFNTSLFLGASFMQWISGKAHDWLSLQGEDMFTSAFLMTAFVLSAGITAYIILRRPARRV
ncbi:MFS transporter [Advenella mimigardefordensis]|nr:MFS transporter [Advenella mimigardefordensis]